VLCGGCESANISWLLNADTVVTMYNVYTVVFVLVGANIHAHTQSGDTALTYSCENGHTDVAEVLLEHGAELVSLTVC